MDRPHGESEQFLAVDVGRQLAAFDGHIEHRRELLHPARPRTDEAQRIGQKHRQHVATDPIIDISSRGLINAAADDRDKIETQLVGALALAHGARLTIPLSDRSSRIARLTFFATRAAG